MRLRALQGRGARLQSKLPGKRPGWPHDIAAPVVSQPLDRVRQPVHGPEAMLDGGDHQVLHILALDPLCRGDIAQRLAVDAAPPETRMLLVRGKGDNQRLVPLHNQAIEACAQWQKLAPWLFLSVRKGTKALTRQITRSNRSALNTFPEISRERAAQFRCEGRGVGLVPFSLRSLDEALPPALCRTRKVGGQGFKVPAQLSLCSLSRRQGGLHSFSRGYLVQRWIGMAGESIVLDLVESCVLGRIVLFQARSMFEEIGRYGLILDPPFWLRGRGISAAYPQSVHHLHGSLFTLVAGLSAIEFGMLAH